jgi:hypothetical protein
MRRKTFVPRDSLDQGLIYTTEVRLGGGNFMVSAGTNYARNNAHDRSVLTKIYGGPRALGPSPLSPPSNLPLVWMFNMGNIWKQKAIYFQISCAITFLSLTTLRTVIFLAFSQCNQQMLKHSSCSEIYIYNLTDEAGGWHTHKFLCWRP